MRQSTGRRAGLWRRGRSAAAPGCEALEGRLLMAVKAWNGLPGVAWIDPLNWSPLGVPGGGDTLSFGPSLFFKSTVNDLGSGPFSLQFTESGYTLSGLGVDIAGASAIQAQQPTGVNVIDLGLNLLADATVSVDDARGSLALNGAIARPGGSTLTKSGPGTLVLASVENSTLGATEVAGGLLRVDGVLGPVSLVGGTLGGTGTVGAITSGVGGGAVSPGASPGLLASGSVAFNAATTFVAEIDGVGAGTDYDQLDVTGTVSLGGAALSVSLGYAPSFGDSFTILNNDGTDPISGRFADLPQGAVLTLGGVALRINYFGGAGQNDVVLTVVGPPVAVDDVYSLPADATLFVPPTGVLLNDQADPNGEEVVPVLVTGPAHGTLSFNVNGSPGSNGAFTYTPAPGFTGVDSFTYYDTDGTLNSNVATVTLYVNATNLPPVTMDDSYTFLAGAGTPSLIVGAPGVLGNDYSPQGSALAAQILNGASHGTVSLAADGSFLYTPMAGFVGLDTFTYRARDAGGLGSGDAPPATVTINVGVANVAPVAVPDTFGATQGKALVVAGPGVLANDTDANVDPSPDTLSAFLVTAPLHGTLDLSSTGQFLYTPDPGYFGTDTFTYRAFDGQLFSNTAVVTIEVAAVNGSPVATDDQYSTRTGTALIVGVPGGVLANDTDPDGDPITAVLVNGVQHGTLTFRADGSFNYTPAPLFSGTDTFTYRASDGTPGGLSDLATVTITVIQENQAPTAVNDAYTTNEGATLSVSAPGVLINDFDLDGDPLSAVVVANPLHGTLVLNSDGTFLYTPDPGYTGLDTFTYRVSDGRLFSVEPATVAITVRPVGTPPIARDDSFTAVENSTLLVAPPGFLLNDSNPDGTPVTVTVINGPFHAETFSVGNDGALVYRPVRNFSGTDSFSYYLTSNGLTSGMATVTITVLNVNQPPVASDEAFVTNENVQLVVAAPGVLLNDVDPDGDALSAVLASGPRHGTVLLNGNGSFAYTPDPSFNGTDSFTYRATDGLLVSNLATVTIAVLPVNQAPTASDDAFTIQGNQRLVVVAPGLLANDSDADGSPLAAVLVNPTLNGTLELHADGSFLYMPNLGFSGQDRFTYRATDGVLASNLATVVINVAAVAPPAVRLDPASDTGLSDSDRITRDNTPTFLGTAFANSLLVLYARPAGTAQPLAEVGRTTTDAAGNFAVTSRVVADGSYQFVVQAFRVDGLPSGEVDAGPLLVDTVGPRVTFASLNPRTGQVYVTYQDDRSGMNAASMGNLGNYTFTRRTVPNPRSFLVTGANVQPGNGPTAPRSVILKVANGRKVPHGRYQFAIGATGVTDVAGNALDGDFNGTLPSGDGVPGTDFNAQFLNGNRSLRAATPYSKFIPVLTTHPKRVRARVVRDLPAGPRKIDFFGA